MRYKKLLDCFELKDEDNILIDKISAVLWSHYWERSLNDYFFKKWNNNHSDFDIFPFVITSIKIKHISKNNNIDFYKIKIYGKRK